MNKKERELLIEVKEYLNIFLINSRYIGRLSRHPFNQPTKETIESHKLSGKKLIDSFNKLVQEVCLVKSPKKKVKKDV